jgi:hypothetical protein
MKLLLVALAGPAAPPKPVAFHVPIIQEADTSPPAPACALNHPSIEKHNHYSFYKSRFVKIISTPSNIPIW